MKPEYIVSACLAGEECRYDGKSNKIDAIAKLVQEGRAITVCPEVLGGLSIPRSSCEIIGCKVISTTGKDCTKEYETGADKALFIAKSNNICKAILKSKSPSCGKDYIYDGTFTRTLIKGNGIFVQKLLDEGFEVYTENDKWE